jgi:pimeloyl-ACP methyl ester carboxylesterase
VAGDLASARESRPDRNGRERIYLDRVWNNFSGDLTKPDEETRAYYSSQYAFPGAMRAGFAQFTALAQDAEDNKVFQQTKLTMPVLAIGGEKSFGATEAAVMRNVALKVTEAVIPGAGHWLMEESPTATVALIEDFLMSRASKLAVSPA